MDQYNVETCNFRHVLSTKINEMIDKLNKMYVKIYDAIYQCT